MSTTTTATRASNATIGTINGSASFEPIKIGSLICKPLHPTFCAEIEGIDFSKPVPAEQIKDVIEAQNRFGVTVYRNTGLTDEAHIAFSRQLGELEKVPKFRGPNVPDRFGYPELFDAGNTNADGTIVQKNSRRWWYNKGNALWHTDSSFNQHRSKYSILLAHRIPSEGGDTGFADVRRAYRDLPEDRKTKLRGLVIKHDLWHSRQVSAPEEYKTITEDERRAKQPAYHKLVQIAPDGEETLYIAAHAAEVVGMSKEESQKLIWKLIDHCTQPQYTLAVKWRQPGDLVFWDNRCTMHRATPFSDQMEIRDMRRTTVYDDGPEKDGVPQAAAIQA
ncbi:alpha-ketoglutarate-dependent 2,4-dichlorophenoxyacetate dioxygenase [Fomitiporia mediterranea MF3/22]|uniref:alpha-ketoglutarate-dependent 2,4-dichlorophenoxyacetate dioxygenase n=1 Tax=Fomitiporia mediterranea (strain MF3/22) TaxID=694068 RepID=UPI0004408DA1|nr:alpha-ketoglutarate-dependent 2,4-dichlorophenoxyacetate dioxygenase [Fomitiporia mediterranea MF3/22]EJD04752.1 alpha-ketoglutarate-dependent 2,4-dichlorophenoxyacetate dioxygenase [Fomitiporia mediterranea MF3/22]